MRKDIFILIATVAVVTNIYYDNALMRWLKHWEKYYKMAGVGIFGVLLFLFFRKNPEESRKMLIYAGNALKHMPLDTTPNVLRQNMLTPEISVNKVQGVRKKRSVSETKKKYVASRQNWRCHGCHEMLTAWFEVDHITPLERGGTNDADNLIAYCRNCHGAKTAMSNM